MGYSESALGLGGSGGGRRLARTRPPPMQCPLIEAIVTARIDSIASAIIRPASAASRWTAVLASAPANADTWRRH